MVIYVNLTQNQEFLNYKSLKLAWENPKVAIQLQKLINNNYIYYKFGENSKGFILYKSNSESLYVFQENSLYYFLKSISKIYILKK